MKSHRLTCLQCYTRLVFFLLTIVGCAQQAVAIDDASLPIPEALKEKIRFSENVGRQLYMRDKMGAIGTDVMLKNLDDAQKAAIRGYLVFREGDEKNPSRSWFVHFFIDAEHPKLAYTVRITPPTSAPSDVSTEFKTITPPRKLSGSELALFRSIRTAVESVPDRPNQPVNPVVLPGELLGEKGSAVYLLAATNKAGVVVFGKHYRVYVSDDGLKATRIEPLSKSVIEIESPPARSDGAIPAGMYITHLLGDYPLETHVFTSLLHRTVINVGAGSYIWLIKEGKIHLMSTGNTKGLPERTLPPHAASF